MQVFDVCIVGAGISGSTLALELAKLGYQVALIEKDDFPRFHIGCSFSVGVVTHWIPHFALTNILTQAILPQHQQLHVRWEQQEVQLKEEKGCLVDRGVFDSLLTQQCASQGIAVYQAKTGGKLSNATTSAWTISFDAKQIQARFLVEATGRKPSVIKTRKEKYLPKLLAVYCFLNNKQQHSSIDAGSNYWMWKTPYKDQCLTVLYSDPETVNRQQKVDILVI